MDLEELWTRFPSIRHAVAFVELCVAPPMLREAVRKGVSLEGMIRWFTEAIDENIAEDDPPNVPELLKAREQFRLPEFAVYLAGRLGLM
jgi:hypothetical protein